MNKKGYTVYVDLEDGTRARITHVYSDKMADKIYTYYINQLRRGPHIYKNGKRVMRVALVQEKDGAWFTYSNEEGFKEAA